MRRRGLTLIEVLAATVLLSLIAATCLPLMQKAARDLAAAPTSPTWDIIELQDYLDEVADDPTGFGIEVWPPDAATINWPDGAMRSAVELRRAHETATHVWLEASCDGQRIFVWAALPDDPGAEDAP